MAERLPFEQEGETPRLYLDSTILIAYTLTRLIEKERQADVVAMIEKINVGEIVALTSFYALHEVLVFALRNAPSLELGIRVGKDALLQILKTEIGVLPMVTREERILNARTFSAIKDSSDVAHAISAYLNGCQFLVSYDKHFEDLPPVLEWKRPQDFTG
jgi:predicted nucleic acid-binding protein